EAATNKKATLLCVLDDETATFGWLKEFDLVPAGSIGGKRKGKQFEDKENRTTPYFDEIITKIKELKASRIVFAGPGFTKDDLKKYLKDQKIKLGELVAFESTNATGVTGLLEIIKNGSLDKFAQNAQYMTDSKIVEQFLAELGKQSGLAEYGYAAVRDATNRGAVSDLVLVDSELMTKQSQIEPVMKTAEQNGAKVHILNHKSDPGKKIAGFGGIVAILRYKTR
ncbi:MAG: hypothetical protein Q7R47_06315, partial [Candidatus Diapherotrites archaeon]|nr:hypothetical protein [Candidatus Diapherotrites archaeon]